jgi:2-polyprenyl-6-methoxyphenol hydroxylase-like FAD-dependent oxidoreductase
MSSSNPIRQHHSDVLIVGAGPTGLALAAALAVRGIKATVVDRQSAGANTSRAAVVHARTLEVLEAIGVADRLVAQGIRAARFTIRDRDRVLVPVQFDGLPTRYPFALMIPQAATEQILRERLAELGGEVQWNRRIARIEQSADGVTATTDDGAVLSARYLVGADGMHSVVRQSVNVSFEGEQYDDSFSLADVRLRGEVPHDEVILYFSPAGLVVVAPLPGGLHRIVATASDAPEQPDSAFVQALLDARGPKRSRVEVQEVVWGSRFRVHHRLAQSYREGRIVLAGDAAHVHSPAGGQGMNTGIQDGIALADALESALKRGDETALQKYEAQRRPIAAQVVKMADRLTRLATVPRFMRPMRNMLLRLLSYVPAYRKALAWRLSGLVNRESGGQPAVAATSKA